MFRLRQSFLNWSLTEADRIDRAIMAGALSALAGADGEKLLTAGKLQLAVSDTENRESAEYAADILNSGLSVLSIPVAEGDNYPGSDKRIRRALRFIAGHYSEAISLEDAAAHVGISPAHLSRLFSLETGSTFSSQLTHYRISRACKELNEGKHSIKEIAGLCGYPDANYFSRAFKKVLGLSPSEWEERQQKKENP
jgi:AraC-like DNA-binding protein